MSNDQFTPPPPGSHDQGPRVTRDDLRDTSRLRRVVQGRQIGGVASGVARYFDVDPTVVRVIWVVSAFFGVGLLAYLALWVLLPEDGSPDSPFGLDERNRGILVAGIAVLTAVGLLGSSWGWFDVPWPLLIVGGVVALVMSRRTRSAAAAAPPAASAAADTGYRAPQPGQVWDGSGWVASGTWSATTAGSTHQGSWQYTDGPHGPGQYWVAPPATKSRKKGPLLFGWTLLAILVATGSMLVVGVNTWSAYPAVALGVVGAMLLLGAFWGRAGGLILVGLLLLPTLAVARVGEVISAENVTWRPTTAAQVQDSYHRDYGRVVLDLSQVSNPEELAGRTIDVSVQVGTMEVILPPDSSWTASGTVQLGHLDLAGHEQGGPDLHETANRESGANPETFNLDLQVDVGELVLKAPQPTTSDTASTGTPSIENGDQR